MPSDCLKLVKGLPVNILYGYELCPISKIILSFVKSKDLKSAIVKLVIPRLLDK